MPGYSRIGGGGGAPDVVVDDLVSIVDGQVLGLTLPEETAISDVLTEFGLTLEDVVNFTEGMSQATLTATFPETVSITSGSPFGVTMKPSVDTYLDRDNGTTAFGTDTTMLAKANTAVINDQKHAYIAWNLTGIDVPSVQASEVPLFVTHDGVGAQPLFYELYEHTSQPFTDSSTWDATEPPPGTLLDSGSLNIGAAGGLFDYGEAGDVLDNTATAAANQRWMYLRFLGNTGVGGDLVTFTINSVENASNQPEVSLTGSV